MQRLLNQIQKPLGFVRAHYWRKWEKKEGESFWKVKALKTFPQLITFQQTNKRPTETLEELQNLGPEFLGMTTIVVWPENLLMRSVKDKENYAGSKM